MRKFFGIDTFSGSRVSEVMDTAAAVASSGYDVVVETDDILVQHMRDVSASTPHPQHHLATAFYNLHIVHDLRVVAFKQPLPRPGLYPRNVNPKAMAIWDRTVRTDKYVTAISFKTPLQAWAIANRYFKAACDNAGVHPYRDEHNFDFDLRDFLGLRLRLAKSRVEQIYRVLRDHNVAWTQHPWKWMKFESDKTAFYVTAVKRIDAPKSNRAKLVKLLKHYEGYHDGDVHLVVTPDTGLYIDISKSKPVMNVEVHIKIPRGLVLKTLKLTQTKAPDEEKRALKLLEALVQAWSHGDLKAVVAGLESPVTGIDLVRSVLTRYASFDGAKEISACTFPEFYDSLLSTCSDTERALLEHTVQASVSAFSMLHRFNRSMIATAAATKQLRTLTDMKLFRLGFEPEDGDDAVVVIPQGAVLIPRKPDDDDPEYFVVLHPESLHMTKVLMQPEQRQKCSDIENATDTFEGSLAAAFEMLAEDFDRLPVIRDDGTCVIKSLGEQKTWSFSGSRVWVHHLNMKSTHPGLTFDLMDVGDTKHLVAIYSGVW